MAATAQPDGTLAGDIRELLVAGQQDAHVVIMLTDEELAALTEDGLQESTPHPWLDAQPDVTTELARRFGLRSLLARSVIVPQVDPVTGRPAMLVQRRARIAVDTRVVGAGLVAAERVSGATVSARNLAIQPELGVFEEDVTPDGFHVFSTCSYPLAASRLATWALPAAVGFMPEPAVVRGITADEWPDLLRSELTGEPDVVTFTLSIRRPEGVTEWVLGHDDERALLARPLPESPWQLQVTAVAVAQLTELLLEQIVPTGGDG